MEQKNDSRELVWEHWARRLGGYIWRNRVGVTVSLLVGILCFLFTMTNKLPNHDDVYTMFFKGATWGSGRWGLGLLDLIFPNYSMPWINGVLAIVLMTAGVCVILNAFHLRNPLIQGLLAASILAFPSLTATMAYMFTVAPFALAFLLAVGAVGLLTRKGRLNALLALILMIGSLSIYQSYVAVTASLLVLLLVQALLEGEDTGVVLRRGVFYLLFLIASLGLYFVATLVLNRLRGISFNGYAGGNVSFDLVSLPSDIALAYGNFLRFFTEGFQGLLHSPLAQVLHVGLVLCTLVLLAILCKGQKKPGRIALLVALVALLPLTINCMYLFTVAEAVHTLVLYGFIGVYVLAALVADHCLPQAEGLWKRGALHGLTLAMALAVVVNIYLANEVSLNLYLRYENAYAFYNTLATELQMDPGYTEGTKIAIVGDWKSPAFYEEFFSFTNKVTGTVGFLPSDYSKERFVEFYLGLELPFATEEEIAAIAATEEFAEMAEYPYYGSRKKIGDCLVVKLSQPRT